MTQISRREVLYRMAIGGAVAPLWLSGCSGGKPDNVDRNDSGAQGTLSMDFGKPAWEGYFAKAFNDLGWNLLPRLSQPNPFISPAGLAIALGMLELGSDGKTRDELRRLLLLPESSTRDGDSWRSFAQALSAAKPKRQLRLANALFLQTGHELVQEFQKHLKDDFLTQAELVDFQKDTQGAAEAIDLWIAKRLHRPAPKTENRDGMTPLTRLVLVNCIQFQGEWDQRFDPALTKEAAFEISQGRSKPFPFMNRLQGEFHVSVTEEARAVRLPFKEGDRALHLILPKKRHGLNGLLQSEGRIDWETILFENRMSSALDVSLPKFLMQSELRLETPLRQLGLATAFDRNTANLSRMSRSTEPLYVQAVVQQTQFLMNEEGARAAAITKVPTGSKSAGPRKVEPFVADQPFLVALTDDMTKSILFLGRVDDPQPIPKDS